MPILYFDNFRGFNSTFLELKNVNFFVGENSTGKTSVLKLIRTLFDEKFWFNLEFANDEADLGYFSEIATDSKKSFDVGLTNGQLGEKMMAYKLKFHDRDGLPAIQEVVFLEKGVCIQILFEGKTIRHRYSIIDVSNITSNDVSSFFRSWVNSSPCGNSEYSTIDNSLVSMVSTPFVLIRFLIAKDIEEENAKEALKDIYMTPLTNKIAWLAPIRTEPKRTYDNKKTAFNPDGAHSPYVLKSMLKRKIKAQNVDKILKKFGRDSGLFKEIKIKTLGKNQNSPFEVYISIEGKLRRITNVGYGVSQILPLIIEVLSRDEDTWFAIQQPEIHLHPRGQAAFGDFIYKSHFNDNKNFIIETHSDYIIDRFRLRINQNFNNDSKNEISSQIVFFNRQRSGNFLSCIPILSDGSLPAEQPKAFREFFIKESIELLKI